MPIRVPRYDTIRELPSGPNQLPSVRQTAAPSADQLGGNARTPTDYVGRGMQSAAGDFMDVGLQMQAREDADLVFRAETVLKDKLRTESEKWSNRRGVQAWNVTKDASSWWDTEAVKAAEGLNDRQRRAFDQTAARMRATTLDSLSRYEAEQRRASLDESAQANLVASINFAAANTDNPDAIRTAREDVARAVAVRAGINGWVKTKRDNETTDALTTLHTKVLEVLADKDPAAAERYLSENREEIAGAKREHLEKTVRGATRLAKAQSFADDVMARGISETEATAEARKQFEGEDERIAIAEVKSRYLEQRQARENGQKDALDEAYAQMGATGTVARIKPSTWAKLGGDMQRRLIEQDEARLARAESRAAARESRAWTREQRSLSVKERETYTNFVDWSRRAADDPASVDEHVVAEEVRSGKLTPSQGNAVILSVRKADLGKDQVNLATLERVIRPFATELKYTGDKAAKKGVLMQVASDEILRRQQATGKPLTQTEMRDIVKDLIVDGVVENDFLWMDSNKKKFEVLGTDKAAKWKPKSKGGEEFVTAAPAAGEQRGAVKPAGKTVIRTGTNKKTGNKVVMYSDGTTQEIPQ